jgi:D-sedoheptulose 7-phosphate isomerase
MKQIIEKRLRQAASTHIDCLRQISLIENIVRLLIQTFRQGKKVLLFGNGGSAAQAQHLAAEFVNRMLLDRKALPAIALNTDTSIMTCVANDADYSQVFSRQIEALGRAGDIAWGLSTSGNSPNVLLATGAARKLGLKTIGFTGSKGKKLASVVDYCLMVPSDSTPRIQEAHISIGHIICELVEQELFGR